MPAWIALAPVCFVPAYAAAQEHPALNDRFYFGAGVFFPQTTTSAQLTTRAAAISPRRRALWFCDTLKFTHIGSSAATYVSCAESDTALMYEPWRCSERPATPVTGEWIRCSPG